MKRALALAFAVVLVGAVGSADARCYSKNHRSYCTDTLSSPGGWAHVTKSWWGWDPGSRTYHASYRATLHDRKGDSRHVRLYLVTNGAPIAYHRATFGRTVRFRSGLLITRHLALRLCTYKRSHEVYCGSDW